MPVAVRKCKAGSRGDWAGNRTEEVINYEVPNKRKETLLMKNRNRWLFGTLLLAGVTYVLAQTNPSREESSHEPAARFAQIIAVNECDPSTFNAADCGWAWLFHAWRFHDFV